MPTYTYACTACGEHLEVVQRFTDPALTECPACAGSLRKVFHPVGVVFKGSGFYKTDSRGKATATKDGAKRDTSAPAVIVQQHPGELDGRARELTTARSTTALGPEARRPRDAMFAPR
ncbi:MAG: FmdB family transcriptional regulator [Frankia sp.]|nr:FmdB family transcriptional regulator [Frankia sp.]